MRFSLCFGAALLAILGLGSAVEATTLLHVDLEDLAIQADRVVRGRVQLERTEADPRTGVIVRVWRLVPEEALAGPSDLEPVEVVTLGGRLGEIAQVVEGAASLAEHDELMLFLQDLPGERVRVVGMAQGVFHVRHRQDAEVVERPGGLDVLDAASGAYVRLEPFRLGLEEFRARVAAARSLP